MNSFAILFALVVTQEGPAIIVRTDQDAIVENQAPAQVHRGPLVGQLKELPASGEIRARLPQWAKNYRIYAQSVLPMKPGTVFAYAYIPKDKAHVYVVIDDTRKRDATTTGEPGEEIMDFGVDASQLAGTVPGTFFTNTEATPAELLAGQCPAPAPAPVFPEPAGGGGGVNTVLVLSLIVAVGVVAVLAVLGLRKRF